MNNFVLQQITRGILKLNILFSPMLGGRKIELKGAAHDGRDTYAYRVDPQYGQTDWSIMLSGIELFVKACPLRLVR